MDCPAALAFLLLDLCQRKLVWFVRILELFQFVQIVVHLIKACPCLPGRIDSANIGSGSPASEAPASERREGEAVSPAGNGVFIVMIHLISRRRGCKRSLCTRCSRRAPTWSTPKPCHYDGQILGPERGNSRAQI